MKLVMPGLHIIFIDDIKCCSCTFNHNEIATFTTHHISKLEYLKLTAKKHQDMPPPHLGSITSLPSPEPEDHALAMGKSIHTNFHSAVPPIQIQFRQGTDHSRNFSFLHLEVSASCAFDVTFPNMLNSGPDVHDINIESQLMCGSYQ